MQRYRKLKVGEVLVDGDEYLFIDSKLDWMKTLRPGARLTREDIKILQYRRPIGMVVEEVAKIKETEALVAESPSSPRHHDRIEIKLPNEILKKLHLVAQSQGRTVHELAADLIIETLTPTTSARS